MNQLFGKKALSVLLVLVLLMTTFAGCAKDGEESKETTKESTVKETSKSDDDKEDVTVEATEERVTITMQTSAFEKTFAAGLQDDPVAKFLEEKFNINLEIIPENSIADVKAKLAAQMATRDLPDIVYVEDDEMKKQMVTSRLALDLAPYKDQLADVEANRPGSFKFFENKYSVDIDNAPVEGLYFIGLGGTQGNLYRSKVGFYVRWDLYEQLGYPEINTYDDYITLAKDMLALEPENADGKPNYGISGWFGQAGGFGPWAINSTFQWDKGGLSNPSKNYFVDFETYEMTPELTDGDSFFWDKVEWWNKAYREGIVDPNSFIQKWPEYLENVGNQNRIMIGWADFAIQGGEAQFVAEGTPEKGYVALPSPMTDRSVTMMASYFSSGNRMYMISETCEHPEKAVELMNYLASWEGTMLIYNGIQGETWDIVDGEVVLFDETIKGLEEDPDYALKTGMNKYNNIAGMGAVDFWPEHNVPAKLSFLPSVLKTKVTQVESSACEYYGVDYPGQIVSAGKDEVVLGTDQQYIDYMALPAEVGEVSERMKEISAQMQEMHFTDYYEAILAESEEDFEKIKAELIDKAIKLGGQELFEYELERFNSVK